VSSRDGLKVKVIAMDRAFSGIVDGIAVKVRCNRDGVS
jgi:hypothetical protein